MRALGFTLTTLLFAGCASQPPEHPQLSVADQVDRYGPAVAARLAPAFAAAGIAYPPHDLALLAFKDSRTIEVYAMDAGATAWTFVKRYPVLAISGGPGPKRAEGDRQVPEGVYHVNWLNPNSCCHLSLHLDYPNAFDEIVAEREGRTHLGRDIAIHGGAASVGCLAVGDDAAEDLFVLSAQVAFPLIRVLISPTDFRSGEAPALPRDPPWTGILYDWLRQELSQFPRP